MLSYNREQRPARKNTESIAGKPLIYPIKISDKIGTVAELEWGDRT
ncbi:uncharacterized protein METZ01_LOCUS212032 [marine metagenome]|uniref:Uncharacterized protein n=1 Tax=marine metagenome TaxID=408172 RepID=A0A382F816_9ZZZZ